MSDEELDALQAHHLASRAELRREGMVVVNGPFDEQSDPSYRGMSIFACEAPEAPRLSDGDPLVVAGRLARDVMEWWVRAGSLDAKRLTPPRPRFDDLESATQPKSLEEETSDSVMVMRKRSMTSIAKSHHECFRASQG